MVAHPPFWFGANPLDLECVASVGWMWLLLSLGKTSQNLGDHNKNTRNPQNPEKPLNKPKPSKQKTAHPKHKNLGLCGWGGEELVAQKEGSGSRSGVTQEEPNISPTWEIQARTPEQRMRSMWVWSTKPLPKTPQLLSFRAVGEDALWSPTFLYFLQVISRLSASQTQLLRRKPDLWSTFRSCCFALGAFQPGQINPTRRQCLFQLRGAQLLWN